MRQHSSITSLGARHVTAACSFDHGQVAISPCAFTFAPPPASGGNLITIQVTPAGSFKPADGRPLPVDAWKIDRAIADQVIARFNARKTPIVLDYEHQTLLTEENGQPAPAAGFFKSLEWREGQGLFATVELTARARDFITNGEYKYFSPVFSFNEKTGAVEQLLMGALTNNPALDGMAPVAMRAAARFAHHTENEDTLMKNKLLLAVCVALAIAYENRDEAAVETDAIKALDALKNKPDPLAKLRADLGVGKDGGEEEIGTAIAALKAKATAAAGNGDQVDPAKFVPIAVVTELQTQVAALTAKQNSGEVDALIEAGLADGRLLKAMEPWARELGKKDVAALKQYIAAAQPIAALTSTQTGGHKPTVGNEHGLTVDELAVCTATGVTPEAFAKAKTPVAA